MSPPKSIPVLPPPPGPLNLKDLPATHIFEFPDISKYVRPEEIPCVVCNTRFDKHFHTERFLQRALAALHGLTWSHLSFQRRQQYKQMAKHFIKEWRQPKPTDTIDSITPSPSKLDQSPGEGRGGVST